VLVLVLVLVLVRALVLVLALVSVLVPVPVLVLVLASVLLPRQCQLQQAVERRTSSTPQRKALSLMTCRGLFSKKKRRIFIDTSTCLQPTVLLFVPRLVVRHVM